jgi:hypothetical protein
VLLLLPLVPSGNDKHDRSISSSNSDCAADNNRRGTLLSRALAPLFAIAVVIEGVTTRGVRSRPCSAISPRWGPIFWIRAKNDIDYRVDLLREVIEKWLIVVIKWGDGNFDLQTERLYQTGRVCENGKSRNVSHGDACVQRPQTSHLNLAYVEIASLG